jgi:hypothetical protein
VESGTKEEDISAESGKVVESECTVAEIQMGCADCAGVAAWRARGRWGMFYPEPIFVKTQTLFFL